ncbi:TPA: hypothetical protein DCW38_07845 [candidate division WOR-3 bacterium]|jgi:tetratricopeptide (TPR) repeat protein|uniref:Tetratricopeptide repeat protein n=1 Tax=candidate division WOR-3 bacterium TaxID=2052148 RepID=A0A350HC07_UNCW3|nr:hypothetical protein [candidate division WOR-3 bacterium]
MKKILFALGIIILFLTLSSKPVYYDDVSNMLFTLYSQEYSKALSQADSIGIKYENVILSDFLRAGIYSTYMSDFETDTLWDSLKKYSDKVIKNHNSKNAYEVFFGGGVYLYRTYFYVWKNDYNNIIKNGINALKYFDKSISMNEKLYDGYLGRGIVNYFIDRFKDKVPLMKPSGDGINEISLAADSGLFTKIPSMDVLAMLYAMDKKYAESESISIILRNEFPENRMFMFTHIKTLLSEEKYSEAANELEILKLNIEKNQRKTYVNLAFVYYNLSEVYYKKGDSEKCRENLRKLMKLKLLTDNKKVLKFVKKGEEIQKKANQ